MRHIDFGTQKKQVSVVVQGMMRLFDKNVDQVVELIQADLEAGVNAIDTADIYGPSEGLIGEAFARVPGLRDQVWLQTKVGIRRHENPDFTYFDFSKDYILSQVDACLQRLQTDHVDSLLLHRPDVLMEPDEVADAFQTLRDAGKVLDFGVSNQNPSQMARLQAALPFPLAANQVQLSAAFTPAFDASFNVNMENDASVMRDGGIFEYCHTNGMAIQAWSIMQYGQFAGAFLGNEKFPELNAAINRIAEVHGVAPGTIATAWVLRHPAKMQAVMGTTNPVHVRESAAAGDLVLSREEWYEIYAAGPRQLP